jgi:hypothetical protein
MGKHHFELPAEVHEVRSEIEQWRQNRQKRSPMPARLWSAAAELAQAHGIYRISQALRLSYESLKKRMIGSNHTEGETRRQSSSGFVEVGGMSLVRTVEHSSVEVEMFGRDGERMVIRAKGCTEVDFASMVDGFWSRNR